MPNEKFLTDKNLRAFALRFFPQIKTPGPKQFTGAASFCRKQIQ
jgi:hypothetical protein